MREKGNKQLGTHYFEAHNSASNLAAQSKAPTNGEDRPPETLEKEGPTLSVSIKPLYKPPTKRKLGLWKVRVCEN